MRRLLGVAAMGLTLALVGSACGVPQTTPAEAPAVARDQSTQDSATLLLAGDLGDCAPRGDRGQASATLAAKRQGSIQLLGDIAYPDGTQANYDECFWPAWQDLRSRTRAAIGNHDDLDRSVFYANWPNSGTSTKPWYSYRLGAWRILVVDSNCTTVRCGKHSEQVAWLKSTLNSNKNRCTLLALHHPRFSSDNEHGNSPQVDALWRAAHHRGIDLVVAGHAHDYERIGPVGVNGKLRTAGPVLFVAGTGGGHRRGFATITPASRVRINDTFGLLRLGLKKDSWNAKFLAAPSGKVRDRASGHCG